MADGVRPELGVGIGWRRSLERTVPALQGVTFVEVVAEDIALDDLPASLQRLAERGCR